MIQIIAKVVLCDFTGYDIEQKCYRCYDPLSRSIRISRNARFWKNIPSTALSESQSPVPETFINLFHDSDNPHNQNPATVGNNLPSPTLPTPRADLPEDAPAQMYPSRPHASLS